MELNFNDPRFQEVDIEDSATSEGGILYTENAYCCTVLAWNYPFHERGGMLHVAGPDSSEVEKVKDLLGDISKVEPVELFLTGVSMKGNKYEHETAGQDRKFGILCQQKIFKRTSL